MRTRTAEDRAAAQRELDRMKKLAEEHPDSEWAHSYNALRRSYEERGLIGPVGDAARRYRIVEGTLMLDVSDPESLSGLVAYAIDANHDRPTFAIARAVMDELLGAVDV